MNFTSPDDIICAPAGGSGGAVSMVRVSGPGCLAAVDKVVSLRHGDCKSGQGFRIRFGIACGLDEVLVSIFRAPHSYTGEDMAEISCHASPYIVSTLLERLCAAGCRMAGPGEFSRRAFMNGKMDLSQAEAVCDLIAADSQASHALAFSQLRGAYSAKLKELRDRLTELCALLELELDFAEEDVEFASRESLRNLASELLAELRRLSDSFRLGNAFKQGIPVVLAGEVNSGKSTLLNALLGDARALVSDIPGTTRDTVEEVLVIDGINFRLIDTAGLRDTAEPVERMGIARAREQIAAASVVVGVLDGSRPAEQLLPCVQTIKSLPAEGAKILWVRNKADLGGSMAGAGEFCSALDIPEFLDISALTGTGIDTLKDRIAAGFSAGLVASHGVLVTNRRHHEALLDAARDIDTFLAGLASGLSSELLAEDLRSATGHLGSIFGEISHEDISGIIFSRFCVGK